MAHKKDMICGFSRIQELASEKSLVIPGHDPLVTKAFPLSGPSGFVWRLDTGLTKKIEGL
jgi:hypothetical protein